MIYQESPKLYKILLPVIFYGIIFYVSLAVKNKITIIPKSINAQSNLSISNISQSTSSVSMYDKFEVKFDVSGTVAKNLEFPYDPETVAGLTTKQGITVDGLFLPPGHSNWVNAIVQPAFLYQSTIKDRNTTAGNDNSEWIYPIGDPYWLIRFAPKQTGTWKFKVRAQDGSNYPSWKESGEFTFSVTSARTGVHGFVQVSKSDPRYFEWSDGTPYTGTGINAADHGIYHSENAAELEFQKYAQGKLNFARTWMSMELIHSRGTHAWDAWKKNDGTTSDSLRSIEKVFSGRDFSVKLSGSGSYIYQVADGNQQMVGGLESGKTYKVRLTANLASGNASDLVVRLLSSTSSINSVLKELGPNGTWQTTDLENGWKRYESTFTNDKGRLLFKGSAALAVGLKGTGTVYLDEIYIGEDLGVGKVGPNVVFKGNLNYHLYFDPISSANYDQVFDHAAKYGLAIKPVISDKQDRILARIRLSDGVFDPTLAVDTSNFHSARGKKSRRLQEYYWRYLTARWGYSRGVHSWELLNEGNPASAAHYDQTNHLAETVGKYAHKQLATTSFWNSFPAKFWGTTNYQYVGYADVHAYISTGWLDDDPNILNDSVLYHTIYSAETRRMIQSINPTPPVEKRNMPIVRGEAGIDASLTVQSENPDLAKDTRGVWLHNYVWAMLHPGGLYELYWWSDNIRSYNSSTRRSYEGSVVGPDGSNTNGLFEIWAPYNDFMSNIPLSKGGYVDIAANVPSGVRALGQKNNNGNGSTRGHVWITNMKHTWKNVVNGVNPGRLSGTVSISGFKPSTSFKIEWWDFTTTGSLNKRTSTISSNSSGIINLDLNSLASSVTDTALKIGDYDNIPTSTPATPSSPTPTGTSKPGDANGDNKVDGLDYVIWLNHYNQSAMGAASGDFNNSGKVDGLDYVIWLTNYGK